MSLFSAGKLDTFLNKRLRLALEAAESADVSAASVESVAEQISSRYGVTPLTILRDELSQLEHSPETTVMGHRSFEVRYRLPYTGTRELWDQQPSHSYMSPSFDRVTKVGGDDHLIITVVLPVVEGDEQQTRFLERQRESVRNARNGFIEQLESTVEWSGQQTAPWSKSLSIQVLRVLTERVRVFDQAKIFTATSDVPVYRAPASEQVPLHPNIARRKLRPDVAAGKHALNSEIYEDIVQTIEQMTRAMERTPTASKLHEEEIRNLILFVLNANYRGAAAGEVFNGEGKTDILLRWNDANAFIGECKFWNGPAAFVNAVEQLHRYVTWRDTKAALVIFIRGGNTTQIMSTARQQLRAHHSFDHELTTASTETRSDFVLRAVSDPDRLITVALIGVVIPKAPDGRT